MKKLLLPNTNLTVSELCMGTAKLGIVPNPTEAFEMMDAFVEQGGNFLDSARVYAAWLEGGANISERTIGEWMQARGNRDQIIISTKGAHPEFATMHTSRLSPADIQSDIADSLHYLQTDVIDIYWLHRDDITLPVDGIIDTMNAQVEAGTIRYFACSNWTVDRIAAANEYAKQNGLKGFIANQPMWSLAEPNLANIGDDTMRAMDETEMAFHEKTNLPVIPFTSQAKGFFQQMAKGEVKEGVAKSYDNPTNQARFALLQRLSKKYDAPVGAIALSYLMSQSFIVIPILGASKTSQLQESMAHASLRIDADDVQALRHPVVQ